MAQFKKLPTVHKKIALSHTVKEMGHFYVFAKNLKIQNGWQNFFESWGEMGIFAENLKLPQFFERNNFLKKLGRISCWYALRAENLDEIALSHTVKETQEILCFCIWVIYSK